MKKQPEQKGETARVVALVVAASVDRACSKKGEVNRPCGVKMVLLGWYIEFGLKSQESHVCFGIGGCNTVSR